MVVFNSVINPSIFSSIVVNDVHIKINQYCVVITTTAYNIMFVMENPDSKGTLGVGTS